MGTQDERMKQWWAALTEQQQAEALRSQETGQVSDSLKQSLFRAGLTARPKPGKPAAVPADVVEFLKMRH